MTLVSSSTLLAFACLLLASIATTACSLAPPTNSAPRAQLPLPTGYVNDFAGVIDSATKDRMEALLTDLKQRADIEIAVVTVKTTGGQDIFNYTLQVARGWGIGSSEGEKQGLVLLVAIEDRNYQIQSSRHLQGDLEPLDLSGLRRSARWSSVRQQCPRTWRSTKDVIKLHLLV